MKVKHAAKKTIYTASLDMKKLVALGSRENEFAAVTGSNPTVSPLIPKGSNWTKPINKIPIKGICSR
jgi:pyruvate/2-oxoglutarate dehydrogenase complex dihydrolipoamide acyltransferase (E2) component